MKVSIVGAGNVATHLARALKLAKVPVLHIWSNSFENAQLLANEVDAIASNDLANLTTHETDIVIIAVKDDAISDVLRQLAGYGGIVAHTSGAVNLAALNQFENAGVFYPLQTFSKYVAINFDEVPICLEANNGSALAALEKLANLLSYRVYHVDSEQRKTLHLAAVFACNFPNYLYQIAHQLLAAQQLDFELLRPLITETAHKVQRALPPSVQTGPAIRNDIETLTKHEDMLRQHPEWLNIYKLLSEQLKKSR